MRSLYTEWEQATERRGLERGQRLVVENLLKARFGTLDTELINNKIGLKSDNLSNEYKFSLGISKCLAKLV